MGIGIGGPPIRSPCPRWSPSCLGPAWMPFTSEGRESGGRATGRVSGEERGRSRGASSGSIGAPEQPRARARGTAMTPVGSDVGVSRCMAAGPCATTVLGRLPTGVHALQNQRRNRAVGSSRGVTAARGSGLTILVQVRCPSSSGFSSRTLPFFVIRGYTEGEWRASLRLRVLFTDTHPAWGPGAPPSPAWGRCAAAWSATLPSNVRASAPRALVPTMTRSTSRCRGRLGQGFRWRSMEHRQVRGRPAPAGELMELGQQPAARSPRTRARRRRSPPSHRGPPSAAARAPASTGALHALGQPSPTRAASRATGVLSTATTIRRTRSSQRLGQRTATTGRVTVCTTWVAALPSSSLATVPCPRLPITTRWMSSAPASVRG